MQVIVGADVERGQEIARAAVCWARASMIRARAAAIVGFSASASRSAVERSMEYSAAGGGSSSEREPGPRDPSPGCPWRAVDSPRRPLFSLSGRHRFQDVNPTAGSRPGCAGPCAGG